MSYYNWPYPPLAYSHDAYNIEDHTTQTTAITKVRVYARLSDNAPHPDNRKPASSVGIRIGGTSYYLEPFKSYPSDTMTTLTFYVTNYWEDYWFDWTINPATGLAWTWADIDALQITIGLMNPWRPTTEWTYRYTYVTQMWVEVEYLVILATVSADPATDVLANSSTLNGTLAADGGEACDCGFEWGETDAYGNTTSTQSKSTGETFSQAISGLDPAKTYHFRAFATNAAGTSYSADRTFTTLGVTSSVTTDPATGVGMVVANINGTLADDGGVACDCGFQWGETVAYGNTTSTQSKNIGETFSQAINGLTPGTTYHFRASSTNVSGTSYGADRTFTTYSISDGGGSRGYALSRHEL